VTFNLFLRFSVHLLVFWRFSGFHPFFFSFTSLEEATG